MKAFDPNYKLLDEMYQDDYYPAFLVDKVKDELQKVIDLLESGSSQSTNSSQQTDNKSSDSSRNSLTNKDISDYLSTLTSLLSSK